MISSRFEAPQKIYSAYFFDCDGTLADSMPLHYQAWLKALASYNCHFPETLFYEWAGKPISTIVADLNSLHGLTMQPQEVNHIREKHYLALLPTIQPIHEVIQFLKSLDQGIPKAVVSGSPNLSVMKTLQYLGVEDDFQLIISAEDYSKGKPDPECYLLAAERLKVLPKECLVLEDAELGIEAAKRAGMSWVKVQ